MEIISGDEDLTLSNSQVPVAAYQAIYYNLTSKVENISQYFDDIYQIEAEDIIQLDNLMNQCTTHYATQGKNSEISISLHKGESYTMSSIDKFKIFNFSLNKPTSKINYSFDFYNILPVEI